MKGNRTKVLSSSNFKGQFLVRKLCFLGFLMLAFVMSAVILQTGGNSRIAIAEDAPPPSEVWDGTNGGLSALGDGGTKGDGTELDPYLISTAEELAFLAANAADALYKTAYYQLTNDIVLNDDHENFEGFGTTEPANQWSPIGVSSMEFSGTFDGNGFSVLGLYINNIFQTQGLFGHLSGATITNLNVSGYVESTNADIGALVGKADNCLISNITVNAVVIGYERVGGVAGAVSNSTLDTCTNSSTVTATSNYVGGIAGHAEYASFDACTNSGAITATDTAAGGIVGITFNVNFNDCHNLSDGTVTATGSFAGGIVGNVYNDSATNSFTGCTNAAEISANSYAGGIVSKSPDVTFDTCTNSGAVTATNIGAGGIAGHVVTRTITSSLLSCTNEGEISASESVGGIVGYSSDATFDTCTNSGVVTATGDYAGGIVGFVSAGSVTSSFLSCTNEGVISADNNAGGIVGEATDATFDNCENSGAVIAASSSAGGIAGSANDSSFDTCKNNSGGIIETYSYAGGIIGEATESELANCENSDKVTANGEYAGGIVGNASAVSFNTCTNSGEVKANSTNAGGIAGYASTGSSPSSFTGCINEGDIEANQYAGGIVGEASNVSFDTCENSGDVTTSANYAGGIVGSVIDSSFDTCTNSSAVTATTSNAGGIAGYANKVTFDDCTNIGDVTATTDYAGGIAGIVPTGSSATTFTDCTNAGEIKAANYAGGIVGNATKVAFATCENSGAVTATADYAGGIVGYVAADSTASTFTDCTNAGIVSADNNAGGIVGSATDVDFEACENSGEVTATTSYAGGIAGSATNVSFEDCENSGAVTATTSYAGGIAGSATDVDFYDCHNLSGGTIIAAGSNAGGIAGSVTLSSGTSSFINCTNEGEISAFEKAGGIAGSAVDVSFANCDNLNDSTITATRDYAGGIVGHIDINSGTHAISDCTNAAEISADSYAGGIAGWARSISFDSCVNSGDITAIADFSGGIAGFAIRSGTQSFSGCINEGAITANSYAGGILGSTNANAEFVACINNGDVSASTSYAGGLAGSGTLTILYCANTGDVSAPDYAGGLVGQLLSGSVELSLSFGTVTGTTNQGSLFGVVGTASTSCVFFVGGSLDAASDNPSLVSAYEMDADGALSDAIDVSVGSGYTSLNALNAINIALYVASFSTMTLDSGAVIFETATYHTVTFSLNGGTGATAPYSQLVKNGEKIAIIPVVGDNSQYRRLDYWSAASGFNGAEFDFDTAITSATTLYVAYEKYVPKLDSGETNIVRQYGDTFMPIIYQASVDSGKPVTFSITNENLPTWLSFDAATATLSSTSVSAEELSVVGTDWSFDLIITDSVTLESYTVTVTIRVTKKQITKPTMSVDAPYLYEAGVERTGATYLADHVTNGIYSLSGDLTAIQAGDYTVTFTLSDPDYYVWADGDTDAAFDIEWSILASDPGPGTLSMANYEYSDTPSTPVIDSESDPNGNASVDYFYKPFGADDSAYLPFTSSLTLDAGKYTLKAVVAPYSNFNGYTATCEFEVLRKKIINPTANTGLVFGLDAFNDPILHSGVTASDLNFMYKLASTSSAIEQFNAGTYSVKFDLLPNYAWADGSIAQLTVSFQILPMEVDFPSAISGLVYNSSVQTGVAYTAADESIKYNITQKGSNTANFTVSGGQITATLAGTYTVEFVLVSTKNYKWKDTGSTAARQLSFTIAKATNPSTATFSDGETNTSWAFGEPSLTILYDWHVDANELNPFLYDVEYKLATASDSMYTDYIEGSTTLLANSYSLRITIKSTDNYLQTVLYLSFVVDRLLVDYPVAYANLEFDGTVQDGFDGLNLNFYEVIGAGVVNAKDAGKYTVIFRLKGNYKWDDGSPNGSTANFSTFFEIAKAKVSKPTNWGANLTFNNAVQVGFDNFVNDPTKYTFTGYPTAINANTYPVVFILTNNYTWDDGTTDNLPLSYTIDKRLVAPPTTPSSLTFEFNGSPQGLTSLVALSGYYTLVDTQTATNVGTYTLKVVLEGKSNNVWDTTLNNADLVFEWKITPKAIAIPTIAVNEFVYNEAPHDIGLVSGTGYNIGGDYKATDAKKYVATLTLVSNNYTWLDGSTGAILFSWEIKKAEITKPTITADGFVYAPNTTHYATVTPNAAYTISGASADTAGTHFVIVTLKNANYQWDDGDTSLVYEESWMIKRATVAKPVLNSDTLVYDYNYLTADITANALYTITGNKEINAGKYSAKIALNSPVNYQWDDETDAAFFLEWNIARATIEKPTVSTNSFVYNASEQSVTIATSTLYSIVGNKATDAGTYTAKVLLINNNYEWADGSRSDLEFSWSITKGAQSAPAVPKLQQKTQSSVTLVPVDGAEYSIDGFNFQDSNVFVGLQPKTEYEFHIRLKATDNLNVSTSAFAGFKTMATITVQAYTNTSMPTVSADYFNGYSLGVPLPKPSANGFVFERWETLSGTVVDRFVELDDDITLKPIWSLSTPTLAFTTEKTSATSYVITASFDRHSGITYSYQWLVKADGVWKIIEGETEGSLSVTAGGEYKCEVVARAGELSAVGTKTTVVQFATAPTTTDPVNDKMWILWLILIILCLFLLFLFWQLWLKHKIF